MNAFRENFFKVKNNRNEKTDYDIMVKILIIGDSAVGKSSIINKFCEGQFSHTHIATIGIDFKIKTIEVEGKKGENANMGYSWSRKIQINSTNIL